MPTRLVIRERRRCSSSQGSGYVVGLIDVFRREIGLNWASRRLHLNNKAMYKTQKGQGPFVAFTDSFRFDAIIDDGGKVNKRTDSNSKKKPRMNGTNRGSMTRRQPIEERNFV